MGRAARWFLGLLGGKKSTNGGLPAENQPVKEKKRWGFVKSFREKEKAQQQKQWPPPPPSEQRKGSYREERMGSLSEGDDQGKRAIAVAAATAAAAEAAVTAARAAAAVVRLTSSGRTVGLSGGGVKREEWAAIKIQAAFRGYLARRALRALKGLVKLQALVRGNIVRKQAAETLRCMQALVRVQARARTCRALLSETSRSSKSSRSNPGPPTPEKYESSMRSNASKTDRSGSLKRNSSKKTRMDVIAHKDGNHSEHWNWLDQWMEERYWDGREVSKTVDDEKNAKILEVDTGKPTKFNSKHKTNNFLSSSSPMNSDQNSRSLAAAPDSPSKDSTTAQLSISSPSSSVHMRHSLSPLRFPIVEPEDLGGSPQFFSATSLAGSSRRVALTPAKSDYSRSLFSGYSDHPNYMANTESSRAKARSQSAPKQRPEFEKLSSIKRLSGQGLGGQKSSLHAKFVNKAYPGSGRLDRLGMPMKM